MSEATLTMNETMGKAASAAAVVDSTVTMATTMMGKVSIATDDVESSNVTGAKRGREEMEETQMDVDAYSMVATDKSNLSLPSMVALTNESFDSKPRVCLRTEYAP